MITSQQRYLALLRWDTPLHIALITALSIGLFLPLDREVTVVVLFVGMILRARSCNTLSSPDAVRVPGAVLMVPLWPALVMVDDLRGWMHRRGFGAMFRIGVTAIAFFAAWFPFITLGTPLNWVGVGAASVSTAVLRERSDVPWYLAPTLIPLAIASASW